ncbi:MAG: low molecular weight phosphotyrosine protein phosphatase [Alistipes sp.]|nr:low molecular weight phosphotyrosine protein phosphatase [Alistipes sp.]
MLFHRRKSAIFAVCLGNICRSPAANGILEDMIARRGLQDQIEVDSAGTYPGHRGNLPDPRMRRAAAERGYDLTHRARTISEDDFYDFDMIIVMDDNNYERVSRLVPERKYLDKLYRMVEFTTDFPDYSYVPDPYYEGAEGFYLVLNMLENGCEHLLDYLTKKR